MQKRRKSYQDAVRIWRLRLQIQKEIQNSKYRCLMDANGLLILMGSLPHGLWLLGIQVDPTDRHIPDGTQTSENLRLGDERLLVSDDTHTRCAEALKTAETAESVKLVPLTDLLTENGTFLPKLRKSVDVFDLERAGRTGGRGIFAPGDKIRIIHLQGEDRTYDDCEGTVTLVDAIGQLHGTWGGLAVIPGEDKFEVVEAVS